MPFRQYALLIALAALGLTLISCKDREEHPTGPEHDESTTITIGVLTDVTGSASVIGTEAWAALELAREDINLANTTSGAGIQIAYEMRDCKSNPDTALAAARELAGKGIKTFIGPMTSAATLAVKSMMDSLGLLVLSPTSVATTLSLPDDNVFRMTPDDNLQANAISALMRADSIDGLVQLFRNDVWGSGLSSGTESVFTYLDGTVVSSRSYVPGDTDFTTALLSIRMAVLNAIATYGASHVGLQVMAFSEIVPLMRQALADTVLMSVRWYGASASAKSPALLSDPSARQVMLKTRYVSPVFGLDEAARGIWEPLISRITVKTGVDPSIYALTAYDAAWLMNRTYLSTDGEFSLAAFKSALVQNAGSYFGATARTEFNANGDRKSGGMDFWMLDNTGPAPSWRRGAQWTASGGVRRM